MPFVSITRLKVKSVWYLPAFMRANEAAVKQLMLCEGLIGGKELVDKNLTFWTLTLWEDGAAMRSFRNGTAHRAAMQRLPYWCDEASYFHWTQEEGVLPGWAVASERLLQEGKSTKVRKPSARQTANQFPPIQWTKIGRVFKM